MSYSLVDIRALIQPYGLILRGYATTDDINIGDVCDDNTRAIAIIGSCGSSAWSSLQNASEYKEYLTGRANPLDRWTKRVGTEIAEQLDAKAVFPFQGPPYAPFLSWAQQLDVVDPSKLGMFIHPDYGLWHAYRFALLFTEPLASQSLTSLPYTRELNDEKNNRSPICSNCQDSPCLTSCPVDAFKYDNSQKIATNYDVERCAEYLKSNLDASCHTQGCLARNACPVGSDYRNAADLQQFHMRAFLKSR